MVSLIDFAVSLIDKIANYFRDDFDVEKILVAILGYFIIELYYIKQKSNELDIKIQHYSDSRSEISKLYGKGEIRESFISFFYSTTKKDSKVLGAICLKVSNEDVEILNLRGNCYEDCSQLSQKQRDDIYKLQKKDILILRKIVIPLNKRIAFKCGHDVFHNYAKLKEFIKENNEI